MTVRAFFKNRWVISTFVVIVVVASVATGVILLGSSNYKTIRAVAGHDITHQTADQFRNSNLRLFSNGAFHVEIIHTVDNVDTTIFLGIGTHERLSNNRIQFNYVDMYRLVGDNMRRDNYNSDSTFIYRVVRGRIELRCPNNRLFFFA